MELLQTILDFLFQSQLYGHEVNMALGPLALMAISSGASLLGGYLSSRANKRQRVETPAALTDQIEELQDPNYFLDSLMRTVNNDQGAYNINASLAARGVDSPAIAAEQREAMESGRQDAIVQGLDQLEGTRLSMLNNLIDMKTGINQQNAQLGQRFNQNRMNIISETVGGIGGSVVQGLGAKINQQNFDTMMNQMNTPTGWQNSGMMNPYGGMTGSASMFDMMMNNSTSNFG